MANLSYVDKIHLEKELEMHRGYVLDFNNDTFKDFISSILHFDVYTKYSGSKANIMREIWKNESDLNVANLLDALCDLMKSKDYKEESYQNIKKIAQSLKSQKSTIQSHNNIQDYKNLEIFIKKANEDLLNGRYWEVITKAKTMLDITFKEVCRIHSLEFQKKDTNKTFTNIRKHFGMDAKDNKYPDYIKGLISNTANLVNNIAEARNKESTSHPPEYEPKKHHAQLCLEQSISLVNFIISVNEYKKQKPKDT